MTERVSLQTPRLRLVAADASLIRMELNDRSALFPALGTATPADWPPPLNDDASFGYVLSALERDPSSWGYWYVIEAESNEPIGVVEIGYSIVPARQRLGFASEAIAVLIGWCTRQGVRFVIAETYPDLVGSIRVMEKNGLLFEGEGSEPGVVRYRRALA